LDAKFLQLPLIT